jgi:DNA-binding transcriptional LysR family regulator
MTMRVDDLTNFVAVAGAGSIAAAAQKLGTTQPTLSKSLARLERGLHASLVERHARGIRLTEAGRAVLSHARNVDLDVRDALAAVRDLRQGHAGTVCVGIGIGIPQALVSAACKPLLKSTAVRLEVLGGMSDSLFRAVASGEADFAVAGVKPPRETRLEWTPLFRDPMIAVAHGSHPLASARSVGWEALARETWLVANVGTMTRGWFEQQFRDRGLEPPTRIIGLRGYPFFYDLAIAAGALMLVPACIPRWARDFGDFAEVRRPADWDSDRVVGTLARADGYLGPAARRLKESFTVTARRMFRDDAP